ncbi:helix-turn-helix domain-containing protein [Streptomyces sp. NPDC056401]|uniref:helix-turn-helix domain-containing protein n=1 Tax=Streptomyces sp. NPDC056401 TaxID=3345809 RepID=UPI0035E11D3B
MTDPTLDPVVQRRARVAELTRDKMSIRDIATTLKVSKDVVYRDRKFNAKGSAATRRALYRDRADQAAAAMEQLHTAVTATAAARPAYQLLVDDDTAAQWIAQLRDDAAALLAVADTFRDYYPHLNDPAATPHA